MEWQAWSERVRKLLPPIKALRSRKLASVEELASLQEQVRRVWLARCWWEGFRPGRGGVGEQSLNVGVIVRWVC